MSDAPENATELRAWLIEVVKTVDDINQKRFGELEKRIETFEQQLALLTQAYAEMAVMIQTILAVKFDEVDQKMFQDVFKDNFGHMIKVFKDGARQAQADHDQFHPGSTSVDDADSETGMSDSSAS